MPCLARFRKTMTGYNIRRFNVNPRSWQNLTKTVLVSAFVSKWESPLGFTSELSAVYTLLLLTTYEYDDGRQLIRRFSTRKYASVASWRRISWLTCNQSSVFSCFNCTISSSFTLRSLRIASNLVLKMSDNSLFTAPTAAFEMISSMFPLVRPASWGPGQSDWDLIYDIE